MNKVFTCTDFQGHWPVGVSVVIVATDERHAKNLLARALRHDGLVVGDFTVQELDTSHPWALLLNDGDY